MPVTLKTRTDILSLVTGKTYYLDAANGSDSNTGLTSSASWKTLSHAQANTSGGDCVMMYSGEYGQFSYSNEPTRTSHTIFMNVLGETPILTDIYLYYTSAHPSYLIFWGLTIKPDWVDPGSVDPQYAESTNSSYNKSLNPVFLYYASYVQIYHCYMEGTLKYLTVYGVYTWNSQYIYIERNEITAVENPVFIHGSYIYVYYNYLHNMAASCIRQYGSNVFIEGNHGYQQGYDIADDYCPRATTSLYHGSAVAIINSPVTIRNNVFHNGFPSAGIMTYYYSGYIYSDVIIENNLLYDIKNVYILRFYLVGKNVTVRNNTIIGYLRDTTYGAYGYWTGIILHSLADGYTDYSELSVYNNIFVSEAVLLNDSVDENNNIFWSVTKSDSFLSTAELANNSIAITTGSSWPTYFSSGFFNGTPNFEEMHGESIDYTLSSTSEGLNFGDSNNQPDDSLGSFGVITDSPSASDQFLLINGLSRSVTLHNAGAYSGFSDNSSNKKYLFILKKG